MRNHFLKGLHDFRRFCLLKVCEDSWNNDDKNENSTEVEVIEFELPRRSGLDTEGDQAEDGAKPEKTRKSAEKLTS